MLPLFPCTKCGLCCRNVGNSALTKFLDRGDSICFYLDLQTNLCNIYEKCPQICRVDEMYKNYFATKFSWREFCDLNLKACAELQKNTQK